MGKCGIEGNKTNTLIENCLYYGTSLTGSDKAGGILGYCYSTYGTSITNQSVISLSGTFVKKPALYKVRRGRICKLCVPTMVLTNRFKGSGYTFSTYRLAAGTVPPAKYKARVIIYEFQASVNKKTAIRTFLLTCNL